MICRRADGGEQERLDSLMVWCKSHSAKGRHGGLSKDTQDPTMSRSEGGDLDVQCVLSHKKSRKGSSLASLGAGLGIPKCNNLWPSAWTGGMMAGEDVSLPLLPSLPVPRTEAVAVEAAIAGAGAGPLVATRNMTDDG